MTYLWGWLLSGAMALLLLVAAQRALRGWGSTLMKTLLGWWLLVIVLVPAQIPRQTDDYAPAFVVFAFETLFQHNGAPAAAGRILLAGSALGLALGLVWYFIARGLSRRRSGA